jgi:hypothetical protein
LPFLACPGGTPPWPGGVPPDAAPEVLVVELDVVGLVEEVDVVGVVELELVLVDEVGAVVELWVEGC